MKTSEDYRMLCAGMDDLSIEEKEKCISFGSAMNALEGTEVTEETKSEIHAWIRGEKTFLEVFETTLLRYGFPLANRENMQKEKAARKSRLQLLVRSKQRKS